MRYRTVADNDSYVKFADCMDTSKEATFVKSLVLGMLEAGVKATQVGYLWFTI